MKIYIGGSVKDESIISLSGNSAPSPLKSLRNQMFITFTTDGNGVGKGFSAIIKFGKMLLCYFAVWHKAFPY